MNKDGNFMHTLDIQSSRQGAVPGGAAGAARYLGIGRTTFYAGLAAGRYPPGRRVTRRRRVWTYAELEAVLATDATTIQEAAFRWCA
jgi:predicted DNA-binding transcriptional regulator AlpA